MDGLCILGWRDVLKCGGPWGLAAWDGIEGQGIENLRWLR